MKEYHKLQGNLLELNPTTVFFFDYFFLFFQPEKHDIDAYKGFFCEKYGSNLPYFAKMILDHHIFIISSSK